LEFIETLKQNFPNQKIERYDERFTSKMAVKSMIEGGLKKKKRADKGMIDQVSATLILQSFLDFKTNSL
jgi:putative Holliday junction resolvase